ncbi:MAG: hypothetical protein SCALA702_01360 [Melioribacteraceae bacterium]|nr:MAG: hypothetical protein SCALA702_01360 [Melioribacteraceae bacterium]
MIGYTTEKMKTFSIILIFTISSLGATRFVSYDGSDIPPYTSWETSSPDLQKVINYCEPWDTVIIGKGVYEGNFEVLKNLIIIGEDRDSTIISYFDTTGVNANAVLLGHDTLQVSNLSILGNGYNSIGLALYNSDDEMHKLTIKDCIIKNSLYCVFTRESCVTILRTELENSQFDSKPAIFLENNYPSYNVGHIESCIVRTHDIALKSSMNRTIFKNNIVLAKGLNTRGVVLLWPREFAEFSNNIIQAPGLEGISADNIDTLLVKNNNFIPYYRFGVWLIAGNGVKINNSVFNEVKNNIFYEVNKCVTKSNNSYPVEVSYNLSYKTIISNFTGNISVLEGNLFETDPMFLNDNFKQQNAWAVHLQYGSPAIDSGDPTIFDIDGSRSDMGAFGGPGGITYLYQDLPPKPVVPDTMFFAEDSSRIYLLWENNSESDLFEYIVYRDTVRSFTPGIDNKRGVTSENMFEELITDVGVDSLFYKVTAQDSTGNESEIESIFVAAVNDSSSTTIDLNEIEYKFRLEQNYPNPFNPSTKIRFSLKSTGNVKLKVYDMKGEEIETLLDGLQSKGYHEIEFDGSEYASSIYIYRLEVKDDDRIPVFSGTGKMVLLK